MVQIGALIADRFDRSHDPRGLLPPGEAAMRRVLAREVSAVREELGEVPIALNAAPGSLEDALEMARSFHEAGGDLFELNCHGSYAKLTERGLLRAMASERNRPEMIRWLTELCRLSIPVIVKFWGPDANIDWVGVLDGLEDAGGLFGVHFNVRDDRKNQPDLDLVSRIRPSCPGLLLCSGCVKTADHVRSLLHHGADCVGIAQGVLDHPAIIADLAGSGRA